MRGLRSAGLLAIAVAFVAASLSAAMPTGASADVGAPVQIATKNCQTVLQCNFRRNGRPRGCTSSYACRACSFVRECRREDGRRVCERVMRCFWGGPPDPGVS
ncbi:MAG: hypothetical protein GC150_06940 [Rhizobiales bacterium]|nr:hypothetical protein [Hyphomicrobiales bacterium]